MQVCGHLLNILCDNSLLSHIHQRFKKQEQKSHYALLGVSMSQESRHTSIGTVRICGCAVVTKKNEIIYHNTH
jgi:hypothetical protein